MSAESLIRIPSPKQLSEIPGRVLLDTNVLNLLFEKNEEIFEGAFGVDEVNDIDPDIWALYNILLADRRANFQFVVSPLSIAEVANIQDYCGRLRRLNWLLDLLDHWLICLDDMGDRSTYGGTVRSRFKLTQELQNFEAELMRIPDLRRDPFDRLLLMQNRMANCDAFMTTDRATVLRHGRRLARLGVRVLLPREYWAVIKPFSAIWC